MTRPIGTSLLAALGVSSAGSRGCLPIAVLAGCLGAACLASQPDSGLRPRWQVACRTDGGETNGGPTAAPIVSGPLVAWSAGRSIHAVRIADGRHPWLEPPTASLIFPRGSRLPRADRVNPDQPLAAAVAGHRLIAVLDGLAGDHSTGEQSRLVCLDMSAAAEGRLVWQAAAPAILDELGQRRETVFDGPPAAAVSAGWKAGVELVCCVVRSRMPADWLAVVAFDLRDGRLLWSRPLGSAVDAAGVDHAPRSRALCLADDLVVIATHAGAVAAFYGDGRQAWRTDLPQAASRPPAIEPDGSAARWVAHAGDRVVVVPADRTGILGLDIRSGRIAWSTNDVADPRIVATTPQTVVISTPNDPAGGQARGLVVLSAVDGKSLSRRTIEGASIVPAANGLVVGPTLFVAGLTAAGIWSLHAVDAETLDDRFQPADVSGLFSRRPFPGSLSLTAVGDSLLLATDGMMVCCDVLPVGPTEPRTAGE
jgi:outer membrane protein assembly factor BamB